MQGTDADVIVIFGSRPDVELLAGEYRPVIEPEEDLDALWIDLGGEGG